MKGILTTNNKGYGRIKHSPDLEPANPGDEQLPVVIFPEFLNTALPDDEVEFRLEPGVHTNKWGLKERHAQILSVIKRARTQHVGTTVKDEHGFYIKPDDKRIYVTFAVSKNEQNTETAKKVSFHVIDWKKGEEPVAAIDAVLGDAGEHQAEITSILIEHDIEAEFPERISVQAIEVANRERVIAGADRESRRDFTTVPVFTIDPANAKDFDDALSVIKLGDDKYEVGVHIADVSHYVTPGTPLDEEAFKRATSVYLVDRVIPMLPHVLSNDVCSLNPGEERRTFSAVFIMDSKGNISDRWFGKSFIKSSHRFTYESAQEVIVSGAGPYAQEMGWLSTITKALRAQKYAEGAIDFDTEEVSFVLDEHNQVKEIIKKQRFEAHRLVEDLMLLANKEVAKKIAVFRDEDPGIYRVHDAPSKERLTDLLLLYKALGFDINIPEAAKNPAAIQRVIKQIEGKPAASLLKTATIRAMSKAIYTTENTGHYGLAFQYYTHFTSPIRRYPDLEVHRLMQAILTGHGQAKNGDNARLKEIAEHSTEREILAAEAERASIRFKQIEYMVKHVGEERDGTISSVTTWGLYIEDAETKSEGMMKLKDFKNDIFNVEEKLMRVVGSRTKKVYMLGDKVRYRVVGVDTEARQMDYQLIETL